MGSDQDPLPPGASGLASCCGYSSGLYCARETDSVALTGHYFWGISSLLLRSSHCWSPGGEDCSLPLLPCRLPSGVVVGSAADGLLLAARSERPWGMIGYNLLSLSLSHVSHARLGPQIATHTLLNDGTGIEVFNV